MTVLIVTKYVKSYCDSCVRGCLKFVVSLKYSHHQSRALLKIMQNADAVCSVFEGWIHSTFYILQNVLYIYILHFLQPAKKYPNYILHSTFRRSDKFSELPVHSTFRRSKYIFHFFYIVHFSTFAQFCQYILLTTLSIFTRLFYQKPPDLKNFLIGYIKKSPSGRRFACKIGVFPPDFQDFAYAFYLFCKFAKITKYMYIPHSLVVSFSATSAFYIFWWLGLHDHFYILHSAYASPGPMSTFCIYSQQLEKETDLHIHSMYRKRTKFVRVHIHPTFRNPQTHARLWL